VLVNLLAYKNHLLAGGQGAAIASNASALQVLHATWPAIRAAAV
jgi:hypothetical protein